MAPGNIQAQAGLIDQTSAQVPGRLHIVLDLTTDPGWAKLPGDRGFQRPGPPSTPNFHPRGHHAQDLMRMGSLPLNQLFPFHWVPDLHGRHHCRPFLSRPRCVWRKIL